MVRSEKLFLWTVYYNPTDFPGQYVGRQFIFDKPTPLHVVEDDLEAVRVHVKRELWKVGIMSPVRLPRHVADEPQIIETWW